MGGIQWKQLSRTTDLFEQAWGIPLTPQEFVQEARSRGHPKMFTNLVPSVINNRFGGHAALVQQRASWFAKWAARAKELGEDESRLKAGLAKHMEHILRP